MSPFGSVVAIERERSSIEQSRNPCTLFSLSPRYALYIQQLRFAFFLSQPECRKFSANERKRVSLASPVLDPTSGSSALFRRSFVSALFHSSSTGRVPFRSSAGRSCDVSTETGRIVDGAREPLDASLEARRASTAAAEIIHSRRRFVRAPTSYPLLLEFLATQRAGLSLWLAATRPLGRWREVVGGERWRELCIYPSVMTSRSLGIMVLASRAGFSDGVCRAARGGGD